MSTATRFKVQRTNTKVAGQWSFDPVVITNLLVPMAAKLPSSEDGLSYLFEDTGLLPNTEYAYRIAAGSASGFSTWVTPITGKTQALTSKVNAPALDANILVSASRITLSWTWQHTGYEQYFSAFEVEYAQVDVLGSPISGWQTAGSVTDVSTLSFVVTGLTLSTTYKVRVRAALPEAYFTNTTNAVSNWVESGVLTTAAFVPPEPIQSVKVGVETFTRVPGQNTTEGSLDVQWTIGSDPNTIQLQDDMAYRVYNNNTLLVDNNTTGNIITDVLPYTTLQSSNIKVQPYDVNISAADMEAASKSTTFHTYRFANNIGASQVHLTSEISYTVANNQFGQSGTNYMQSNKQPSDSTTLNSMLKLSGTVGEMSIEGNYTQLGLRDRTFFSVGINHRTATSGNCKSYKFDAWRPVFELEYSGGNGSGGCCGGCYDGCCGGGTGGPTQPFVGVVTVRLCMVATQTQSAIVPTTSAVTVLDTFVVDFAQDSAMAIYGRTTNERCVRPLSGYPAGSCWGHLLLFDISDYSGTQYALPNYNNKLLLRIEELHLLSYSNANVESLS